MLPIVNLALKDLKVLWRDKLATFFMLGFPVLMGLFFGFVFGGNSGGGSSSKVSLLIVDEDQTEVSQAFAQLLKKNDNLSVSDADRASAENRVRTGKSVAFLAIPKGYGETAGAIWQEQVPLELGVDPSHAAEGSMIEGFIMQASGEFMMNSFSDTNRTRGLIDKSLADINASEDIDDNQRERLKSMFGNLDFFMQDLDRVNQAAGDKTATAGDPKGRTMSLASINRVSIAKDKSKPTKPASGFAVSFPQGMIWGVLACCAGFAISIARERSRGTLLRLQASPLSVTQVLLGKAVACFFAVCVVILAMTILGKFMGLNPGSYPLLMGSALATAICFVGIMMTMSNLGKTEESVSGSGWAINTIMAMLGGGMIPLMVMPQFFRSLSLISPVRWAIYSLEGAIWRELTLPELLLPWTVLIVIGVVGFGAGSVLLQRSLSTS